jgi:hypothetical protein
VAISQRDTSGPEIRPRHAFSALIMILLAAFATWNVLHNGNWAEVVLPFGPQYRADVAGACGLAVVCWAGGVGLLTGSSIGLWLGRLAAAVLFAMGAWFLWDAVAHPTYSILFGNYSLVFAVPVSVLLMGPALGMLLALRPGARRGGSTSPR